LISLFRSFAREENVGNHEEIRDASRGVGPEDESFNSKRLIGDVAANP
jgi:hypothetical protein